MTDNSDPIATIAESLASVIELARRPDVTPILGASTVMELATVVAGFRQRFPSKWPAPQGQLPFD
ncbi:hypothetical protein H8A99_29710 [Bradyrhizobium sp. Arg68]|uniref:hypothetical protein n=1 Tax=Bradyrhizobium ivorense TaxID=2511166 RepID=UPI001E3E5D13|nr:hypothetical protein [Bradyrhizobium ivorense]MCC8940514.1 hypothetical protein [Bradyrhizobium ivorense]